MVFCFLMPWDRKRMVRDSTPAKIPCASCGGAASELKVRNTLRFCFIPLCWTTSYIILCQTCEWKALCKFNLPGRRKV
ncbi:hypothetical protein Mapa_005045 [Marchantia paleacea]|nr:hypothetical protein Mapa_005045 [Marchantia paleacea]